MKLRFFIFGALVGSILFIGANIYSYSHAVPPCCDQSVPFGIPFQLGTFGGYFGHTSLLLTGLIADSLIGIGASLVSGWVFVKLLSVVLNIFRQTRLWHIRTRL